MKDDIINSVIKLIIDVADMDESTRGIYVIRRFEDAVRPTKSHHGESIGTYSKDLYGEISLDELEQEDSCVGEYKCEDGSFHAFSENTYKAKLDIDFVDCGAFDFASNLICKLSVPYFREKHVPEGIKIESITNITDVTALEGGTVSRERVTFSIYVRYKCLSTVEIDNVCLNLEIDECGDFENFPIEFTN